MIKKDWNQAIRPLLKEYKGRRHPLEYRTIYQLIVMVILAAGDSDVHINHLAPGLFAAFPDMAALSKTTPGRLHRAMGGGRNFAKKSRMARRTGKKDKKRQQYPPYAG